MNLLGKHLWKHCGRRKAAIRLAVESLEDRAVPAGMMTSAAGHMATSALLSEKAAVLATMPDKMQIIDRAPAAAQAAGQLSHSPSSQANNAAGMTAGAETALDTAASDAAWIDSLMQQYSAAQGAGGKDRLGNLIESEGPMMPSNLSDRLQTQGQQEMKAMHDALAANGFSQHDLDRIFGRDNQGGMNLVLANLGKQEGEPSYLSQLPFLSVTRGQDPIQVGATHAGIDPRTAEDGDAASAKPVSSAVTGAEESKGKDGSTKVTVDYKDGSKVTVTLPNGSNSATVNAPNGVSATAQVSDGTIKSVTATLADGSKVTVMWDKGAGNDGGVATIDWHANGDGIARIYDGDGVVGNVLNLGHMLHTGGTIWVISSMPNPDAETSGPAKPIPGVSGDTGVTPVGVGGAVDPMDPDHHHAVDVDKLARGIVTHAMSTVNPNPNGPGVGGDAGGGLPGYHGPIDYDQVHNISNPHPGGKPTIVVGPPAGPKGGI
ncbi:MAG TPA: hypothetical protein VGZ47_04030 [Gemmataceae bacterium]|jgi:hypothetical protein|nr:hypothetical protein [Gemmataceae bacterium]